MVQAKSGCKERYKDKEPVIIGEMYWVFRQEAAYPDRIAGYRQPAPIQKMLIG